MISGVELACVVIVAAAISAALVIVLLPWLRRRALAHVNHRSSHVTPTPQGGGIAVIAATMLVVLGGIALGLGTPANGTTFAIVLAATAFIALVGAVDDIHTIDVAPRFALQAIAVAAVIACLPADLRVIPGWPWWIERALIFIALLWFVNLTNFMDGIDWITVAEIVPIAVGLVIVGFLGALPSSMMLAALALCGALLGFAPFNRPVARIFLGDVGSLPVGLLVGWLLIELAGRGHLVAALILPLYYLADATLTLIRRIGRREAFWKAHRSHFYQVATTRGFSVMAVVSRVFALNVLLVALATASVLWPWRAGSAVTLALATLLVGGLLRTLAQGKS